MKHYLSKFFSFVSFISILLFFYSLISISYFLSNLLMLNICLHVGVSLLWLLVGLRVWLLALISKDFFLVNNFLLWQKGRKIENIILMLIVGLSVITVCLGIIALLSVGFAYYRCIICIIIIIYIIFIWSSYQHHCIIHEYHLYIICICDYYNKYLQVTFVLTSLIFSKNIVYFIRFNILRRTIIKRLYNLRNCELWINRLHKNSKH